MGLPGGCFAAAEYNHCTAACLLGGLFAVGTPSIVLAAADRITVARRTRFVAAAAADRRFVARRMRFVPAAAADRMTVARRMDFVSADKLFVAVRRLLHAEGSQAGVLLAALIGETARAGRPLTACVGAPAGFVGVEWPTGVQQHDYAGLKQAHVEEHLRVARQMSVGLQLCA